LNRKGRSLRNGARIGLACIELKGKNKSQQRSTTQGGKVWSRHNEYQQKSTESAKVSKNHHKSSEIITGLRSQSSKIINNHHKSSKVSPREAGL